MGLRTTFYREILRDYDRTRTQKAAELRERKAQLYTRFPRLAQIEQELSLLGVQSAKAALLCPQEALQTVQKLQQSAQALHHERSEILQNAGILPNALELEYVCPLCKDTGFADGKECLCMKQKLMDKLYRQSNIHDIIQNENFDTFQLKYYSNAPYPQQEMTPRENMEHIYKKALSFAEQFPQSSSLLLWGPTGLGKTFLCNCIAKEVMDKGYLVLYFTAGQLCRLFEDYRFGNKDAEEETQDPMEDLLEADLLIIDDLGTEFSTVLTSAELFRIINERALAQKPVVLSTNLSADKLIQQYSDRILSRIRGTYEVMAFYGDDIRIRKKYEGGTNS